MEVCEVLDTAMIVANKRAETAEHTRARKLPTILCNVRHEDQFDHSQLYTKIEHGTIANHYPMERSSRLMKRNERLLRVAVLRVSFDEHQVRTFVYEKETIDGPSVIPRIKQPFTEFVFIFFSSV
ncbi:hypothetical protein Tcan_10259 [Toxocara canis]|uniref:Uncharacterized protein n=1 Tax=Toxocara canis TaxID=6265 RepID=A0A0B2UNP2_TOXCA|nr:hypothetical protein Tcan_10259 [Toxocara canis]